MKMKYIIFDKRNAVIFNPVISHDDVRVGYRDGEPTSAGFVTLVPINQIDYITDENRGYINSTVHGESISLGIKSNGDEDNKIIEKLINSEDF